jgi:hypothetical protein
MEKKTWKEFQNTGLLWFVNTTLHVFGWAIVFRCNEEDGSILEVYPARVKFRGFEAKSNDAGYVKLTQYMKDNSDKLLEEVIKED